MRENSHEDTIQKKRRSLALFFSLLFHGLLLLIIFFVKPVKKESEKPVVIKVTLAVPVTPGTTEGGKTKAAGAKDKPKKTAPSAKKVEKTKKKNIQEKKSPEKKVEKKNIEQMTPSETVTSADVPVVDSIKEKLAADEKRKNELEKEFFSKNSENPVEDLPEIGDLDSLFGQISDHAGDDAGGDDGEDAISKGTTEGISWGSGGSRKLKYSAPIVLPDDMKNSGLKFSVVINFTVLSDGIIASSSIGKSSGNTAWDELIRNQFSRWTFERSTAGSAAGSIRIDIGY